MEVLCGTFLHQWVVDRLTDVVASITPADMNICKSLHKLPIYTYLASYDRLVLLQYTSVVCN